MNEKRKPEGELLLSIFLDERIRVQRLLQKCKENDRRKNLKAIKISNNTWYLLPEGTDVEKWKKIRNLI